MAILDIERYYYFKMRNGNPYAIKISLVPINTTINRSYVAMTDEQKTFYLEHPTATVNEVWNCEITPPYVPPTPDVEEYAAEKVKELKDACYGSVSVTSLEYAMAMDKTQNITADSYYTLQQATQVIKDFRSQSKHAMQVLNTYKPQIEEAQTIEAIDEIYQQAMEEL
ncbi:MAG: hypothetical protein PUF10_02965 [Bacteroidales bacterium]|nr:hypothetical protein [Bacteroidales bacterium]